MKTLNKKWAMRKLNEGLKPSWGKITSARAKRYLAQNPKTSKLIRSIMLNLHVPTEVLAKRLGRTELVIDRFKTFSIKSIAGVQKFRGKSKKKKPVKIYKSSGKDIVRSAIMKLLMDKRSPKEGIVATLPFMFALEMMILKVKELNGLFFNAFEYAYNLTKGKQSRATFAKQYAFLLKNRALHNRVLLRYENINDSLRFGGADQYAHIFADYCGTLETNQEAIEYVLKNKLIKKGGIFWITLCTRSVYGSRNIKSTVPKLIKKWGGNDYKLEKIEGKEVYSYMGSDSGKGSPIIAIAVRRVK